MRIGFWMLLIILLAGQALPFLTSSVPPGMPPSDPSEILSPAYAAWSRAYCSPFRTASLCRAFSSLLLIGLLLTSSLPGRLEERLNTPRRWLILTLGLLAFCVLMFGVKLPYGVGAYIHGRAFGLVTAQPFPWLVDQGKVFSVGAALFTAQYLLLYCMISLFPNRWWLAGGVLIFILFNLMGNLLPMRPNDPVRTLVPMNTGPYADALRTFTGREGLHVDFFTDDTSVRNDTVNAYLDGRESNRYMVFSDTFLRKFTPDDAVLALAHELGHLENQWRMFGMRLAASALILFPGLYLAFQWMHRKGSAPGVVHSLIRCILLTAAFSLVLAPVSNAVNRLDEELADRHAVLCTGQPEAYRHMLAKGAMINLEEYAPPKIYSFWFLGYPRLCSRLENISDMGAARQIFAAPEIIGGEQKGNYEQSIDRDRPSE